MWKFLGQGSNLLHSSNPGRCSDNARSLPIAPQENSLIYILNQSRIYLVYQDIYTMHFFPKLFTNYKSLCVNQFSIHINFGSQGHPVLDYFLGFNYYSYNKYWYFTVKSTPPTTTFSKCSLLLSPIYSFRSLFEITLSSSKKILIRALIAIVSSS